MSIKKGDQVKCISHRLTFISFGKVYEVLGNFGTLPQLVIVRDDQGDKVWYPVSVFESNPPDNGELDEDDGLVYSDCCGAVVYDDTDICSSCKEHI